MSHVAPTPSDPNLRWEQTIAEALRAREGWGFAVPSAEKALYLAAPLILTEAERAAILAICDALIETFDADARALLCERENALWRDAALRAFPAPMRGGLGVCVAIDADGLLVVARGLAPRKSPPVRLERAHPPGALIASDGPPPRAAPETVGAGMAANLETRP